MIIISKYKLKVNAKTTNRFKVISYDEKKCPACGGNLIVIGSRPRHLVNEAGDKVILDIRKLSCEECGKTHSELPDAIFPYHRLCVKTMKSIIEGDRFEAVCDRASYDRIRAWWSEFSVRVGICTVEETSEKINSGAIFWMDFISHTHLEHTKNQR